LGADFNFIVVMDEEGNEMTIGVVNVQDTTAIDMKSLK
jgi:hypothetical protein